jgi:hypothetical protein
MEEMGSIQWSPSRYAVGTAGAKIEYGTGEHQMESKNTVVKHVSNKAAKTRRCMRIQKKEEKKF